MTRDTLRDRMALAVRLARSSYVSAPQVWEDGQRIIEVRRAEGRPVAVLVAVPEVAPR